MQRPETAPQRPVERVTDLLKSAAKPTTFAQLKNSSRLTDTDLKAALESALEQSAVFRWPDYRKSQRTALATRSAMDRIVGNLLASQELLAVPDFTAGKLPIRAGTVAPYQTSARKFIGQKFRKAGLSSAGLFAAAAPTADLAQRILERVRSIEPVPGVPVTTQRLRQALPDFSKQDFDAAALELRKRHEVSLSLHHDPHNLLQADLDLLIDGRDGHYYVAIAIR
jgi:hypothetical protein